MDHPIATTTDARPWYQRAIGGVVSAVVSALSGSGAVSVVGVGSSGWGWPQATAQLAMQQYGQDPWVLAAVRVASSSVAGLPLYAVEVGPDGVERRLMPAEEPEILRRLRAPAPGISGRWLRAQLVADFMLSGGAYCLWYGAGDLRRLAPGSLSPSRIDRWGDLAEARWSDALGGQETIQARNLIHVRGISGSPTQDCSTGTAPIGAIIAAIETARKTKFQAAKQAGSGAMRWLLNVPQQSNPGQLEAMKAKIASEAAAGSDFMVVSGSEFKAQQLGSTIRDMDFPGINDVSRNEIAAVFGVPGTKLGILSASYGQSRQEDRAFWESLRIGVCAAIEDAFSAATGNTRVRIRFDFASVEAIQAGLLDRVTQVAGLVNIGVDPAQALIFAGLTELADDVTGTPSGNATGAPAEAKPVEPRRAEVDHLLRVLRGCAAHPDSSGSRWYVEAIDRGADHATAQAIADELAAEERAALDAARDRAADHGRELSAADVAALPIYGEARALRVLARLEP